MLVNSDFSLLLRHPVVQSRSLFFFQRLENFLFTLFKRPLCIGVTGGSGSGKSNVAKAIKQAFAAICPVSILSQDNYYRDFNADFPHISVQDFYHQVDLDEPMHIDFEALARDIMLIKAAVPSDELLLQRLIYGTPKTKPTIDEQGNPYTVAPINVVEGIFTLQNDKVASLYDLTIYVDVDENIRRQRWLYRNQQENRGTTDHMWQTTQYALQQYIAPRRNSADIVLNSGGEADDMDWLISQTAKVLLPYCSC